MLPKVSKLEFEKLIELYDLLFKGSLSETASEVGREVLKMCDTLSKNPIAQNQSSDLLRRALKLLKVFYNGYSPDEKKAHVE